MVENLFELRKSIPLLYPSEITDNIHVVDMTPKGHQRIIVVIGATLVCGALAYLGYRTWELSVRHASLGARVAALEGSLRITEQALLRTKGDLAFERDKSANLEGALAAEQSKNNEFERRIGELSGTVGFLQKKVQTDPQLLKKYSKVYFLNENYAPEALTGIDQKYWYDKSKSQLIHARVKSFLEAMLNRAETEGISIRVLSGFRSFAEQTAIKSGYTVTYGSGANKFSADQGYSEHQLGTAADLTTPEAGNQFSKFEASTAYKWLAANAWKFGFILSYPKGNQYYIFEPWHWRFVGWKLSAYLHDQGKNFYDLSQRELDEFLVSIFD